MKAITRTRNLWTAVSLALLFGLRASMAGDSATPPAVTITTHGASMPFEELHRKGLTIVALGTQLYTHRYSHAEYHVPSAMRFRDVDGRALVEALANSRGLKVAWVRGGSYAVMYRGAPDADIDTVAKDLTSADAAMRRNAAWRCGSLWDIRIVPLLIKAARDADPGTAREALASFRRLQWDGPLAIDGSVVDLMAEDCAASEPRVRGNAVCALRHASGAKAKALLEKALADKLPTVREEAASGLSFIDGDQALAIPENLDKQQPDWDKTEQQLMSGNEALRRQAMFSLLSFGGERALALAEKAFGDANPKVRETAVVMLSEIGGDKALVSVEKALADSNNGVRHLAMQMLTKFDEDRVVEVLDKCLSDKEPGVRVLAAVALERTRGEKARGLLQRAFTDRELEVRYFASRGLARIGDEKVLLWLENQFGSSDHLTRSMILDCAGAIGGERALTMALRAYEDPDTRGAAIPALAQIGGEKALATLVRALADSEPRFRAQAATALGNMGGDEALALIEKALGDPDFRVRRGAANGLEQIGGEKAAASLLSAMKIERDKRVRNAVMNSGYTNDPSIAAVRTALKTLPPLPEPEYSLPPAEKVFAEGLEKATKESKRIFLVMGFPECGPCRMFDKYHADERVAEILGKYFVVLKIDTENMLGGWEFFQKYGSGGAPSYVVLDTNRKVLAKGSGFPSEDDEPDYRTALKAGSPDMPDHEIKVLLDKAQQYAK